MVEQRVLIFWLVGTICIFFGSLIAGNVDPAALGATTVSITLAYIISFILILIGGMFWISTAVASME